jgi:hypothetical protein
VRPGLGQSGSGVVAEMVGSRALPLNQSVL